MPRTMARPGRPARASYGNPHDARYVQRAREQLELTQTQLGEHVGLSQASISLIESRQMALPHLARREIEWLFVWQRALKLIHEFAIPSIRTNAHGVHPILYSPGAGADS